MPNNLSCDQQTKRFYRRKKVRRIVTVLCGITLRVLGIFLTAVCTYWVFFDDDALIIKGFAAAALFVLLYAQCASFSMLGLRMFARREVCGSARLSAAAVMICMPLYFVVLVISIIPLTERAAFFLTVFPTLILNALPMESVRDEMSLRGLPTPLFWAIQLTVQMLVFALGQSFGLHLMTVWG